MSDSEKNKFEYLENYSEGEEHYSEEEDYMSFKNNFTTDERIFLLLENIKNYINDRCLPICQYINFHNLCEFLEK